MEPLLVAIGLLVVALVVWDIVETTVSPASGAGPITRVVGHGLWRLLHVGSPSPQARRLGRAGLLVFVATLVVWVAVLVVGWWLVMGQLDLVNPDDVPASAGERLAFTMTTVSSLGPGYLVPRDTFARLVTAFASVSGLGLITLSVTYALPVVTAVSERRIQAMQISSVGSSAEEIARSLEGTDEAATFLRDIASQVRTLAQRHLAYPVLHYFHATSRDVAYAPSVAALDEAVTSLVLRGQAPDAFVVHQFRAAVDELLQVTSHHLEGHLVDEAPPWPDALGDLDGVEEASGRQDHRERRRRLAAFVADSGWNWPDHVHERDGDSHG